MKFAVKELALGIVVALVLSLFMAGCNSEPPVTPIDKRAPGKDITPEMRAEKRGEDSGPGAPTGK
jgi:hypothetical protein